MAATRNQDIKYLRAMKQNHAQVYLKDIPILVYTKNSFASNKTPQFFTVAPKDASNPTKDESLFNYQ